MREADGEQAREVEWNSANVAQGNVCNCLRVIFFCCPCQLPATLDNNEQWNDAKRAGGGKGELGHICGDRLSDEQSAHKNS